MSTPIKYVNCNALVKQNNISKYTHKFCVLHPTITRLL